jgi:phage tail-like protein
MFEEVIHQVQISGPQGLHTYVLPPGVTTIGRQGDNDLVFVHPLVSRKHTELTCLSNEVRVTDLGSTHGTMVNREMLSAHALRPLKSGDVIEIGPFRLAYERVEIGQPVSEVETPPLVETAPPAVVEELATAVVETAVAETTVPPSPPAPPPRPIQEWKTAEFVPMPPLAGGNGRGPGRRDAPLVGDEPFSLPPGLSLTTSRYLEYLPDIYRGPQQHFMARFLALLESILAPIEWTVENFDLFLDPKTAPTGFLPWLASWYDLTFDGDWNEAAQRALLEEAHHIYRRRGTAWALRRLLEIYTGRTVEIDDQNDNLADFTFAVRIAAAERPSLRATIEQLINTNKPAHTSYTLQFIE